MRRLLASAALLIVVLTPFGAFGQGGTLCLYADPGGLQCNISDDTPGVLSVYVIHTPPSSGVTGAVFAAPKPSCMTGVSWLTDSSPFNLANGNSQSGATIAYGACLSEPSHVLTIQYMASGASESDCAYGVVPAPGYGFVQATGCDYYTIGATGGVTYVNSSLPCECSEPSGPPDLFVHPSSLYFGPDETSLELWVENLGGGTLSWTIGDDQPWLNVDVAAGVNDRRVRVWVNRSGLVEGTYEGNLTISGGGQNAIVSVTMVVAPTPLLSVTPTVLPFNATSDPKSFLIENVGTGTLTWTLTADRPWISIAPPLSGSGAKWVSVLVVPPGPAGPEDGRVSIESNGGTASVLIRYTPELGEAGIVGVFEDPEATRCNLFDHAPGVMTVHIVHVLTAGATGAQFAAPMPSCMTGAVYLGETSPFPVVLGNSQTAVSVAYGPCLGGTIPILAVRYLVQGTSQSCCEYPVIASPWVPSGRVQVATCDYRTIVADGAHAIVNPTPTCACGSVRAQDATWGHIKALYAPEGDR